MNTDSTTNPELARLSRAVRFGLASIVLGLSYPNIHCALTYKAFQEALDNNQPAGFAAALLSGHQPIFVGLSFLLPLAAVVCVFTPGMVRSIYVSGFLVIAVFVQLFLTFFAVMDPISKMSQ